MSATFAMITDAARKNRIFVSRVLVGLLFPVVLCTRANWAEPAPAGFVVENAGFFLIIVGAFGRLWAMLYIAGRKGKQVVTAGPYSICRNPLYFFSLLMGLGIAASFQNALLLVPLVVWYLGCYFFTILSEERELAERFGAEYQNYRKTVPRLFPALWRYRRGAETWTAVREGLVLRYLFESALFVLIIPFAEILEELHLHGIVPVIFRY